MKSTLQYLTGFGNLSGLKLDLTGFGNLSGLIQHFNHIWSPNL